MKSVEKIVLGVPVFNRLSYVKKMVASLQESVDLTQIYVCVYDDKSTEFTSQQLKDTIPFAYKIVFNECNLKADGNTLKMYKDFLNIGGDILINADSDIIYRPGWLDKIKELLPQTDGILSLYNSNMHNFIDNNPYEKEISPKYHLGAAGTVFTRERVQEIVNLKEGKEAGNLDWDWSDYFVKQGLSLYSTTNSYIQHIGIQGQNNHGDITSFDIGQRFYPINIINQQIIDEFIFEMIDEQRKYMKSFDNINSILKQHTKYNTTDLKYGHLLLKLPRLLKRLLTR